MSKKVESKQVNVTPDELLEHLDDIINGNIHLQEKGQPCVSVEIMGGSGIGKTSLVEQKAKQRDLNYVKLNLSQIGEEVSELVGYPIRQFEMSKEEERVWADEQAVDAFKEKGYHPTGKNKTSYCPPEWIANIDPSKGGIFNLDDWTRKKKILLQSSKLN